MCEHVPWRSSTAVIRKGDTGQCWEIIGHGPGHGSGSGAHHHVHATAADGILAISEMICVKVILWTLVRKVRVRQADFSKVDKWYCVDQTNRGVHRVLCKIDDRRVQEDADHLPRVLIRATDLLAGFRGRIGDLSPMRLQHGHELTNAASYARPAKALRNQPADQHDVVPERGHQVGDGGAKIGGTLLVTHTACGRRAKAVAARAVQVVALLYAVCKQEKEKHGNWLGKRNKRKGRVCVLAMKLTKRIGTFHVHAAAAVAVGVLRPVEQHARPAQVALGLHGGEVAVFDLHE
jgi:hypothetical protein